MNIKTGSELLSPFITKADKDTDPYLLVHFSREDDKYEGTFSDHLDFTDAAIVLLDFMRMKKINKQALIELINSYDM